MLLVAQVSLFNNRKLDDEGRKRRRNLERALPGPGQVLAKTLANPGTLPLYRRDAVQSITAINVIN